MAARKPLIAGNWKMFGRQGDLGQIQALVERIGPAADKIDVLICPPAAYIPQAVWASRNASVRIGAQDCSPTQADAARTGDISAAMLADVGARYVLVGHSERRAIFGDTDALVRAKAEAAIAAGLAPIICVGESRDERASGRAEEVVARQVRACVPTSAAPLVVAYEPVWAIGGDATPTVAEITAVHAVARAALAQAIGAQAEATRILYGGSVSPANAAEVFSAEGVDGALVGRASLKAEAFSAIILAHPAAS